MRSLEEFCAIISSFLREEERILQSRVDASVLVDLCKNNRAYIHFHKKQPIAFGAVWPTHATDWVEVGTLWVHPDYRGKKLCGKKLCSEVLQRCEDLIPPKANAFLITKSIKVVHLVLKNEWNEWTSSRWDKDPKWKKIAEPWDRYLPGTVKLPSEGRLFTKEIKKSLH